MTASPLQRVSKHGEETFCSVEMVAETGWNIEDCEEGETSRRHVGQFTVQNAADCIGQPIVTDQVFVVHAPSLRVAQQEMMGLS